MTNEELIKQHQMGKSISALNRETNIPYGRIQKILKRK